MFTLSLCPLRHLGHLSPGSSCNFHRASFLSSHLGYWPWVDVSLVCASFPQEQEAFLLNSFSYLLVSSSPPRPALVSCSLPRLSICCSSLRGGLCGGRSLVVSQTTQVLQPETRVPSWTPVSPSHSCSSTQVLPVLFLKWSPFTSLDLHCHHLAQAPTSSSLDYCSRAWPCLSMDPLVPAVCFACCRQEWAFWDSHLIMFAKSNPLRTH